MTQHQRACIVPEPNLSQILGIMRQRRSVLIHEYYMHLLPRFWPEMDCWPVGRACQPPSGIHVLGHLPRISSRHLAEYKQACQVYMVKPPIHKGEHFNTAWDRAICWQSYLLLDPDIYPSLRLTPPRFYQDLNPCWTCARYASSRVIVLMKVRVCIEWSSSWRLGTEWLFS